MGKTCRNQLSLTKELIPKEQLNDVYFVELVISTTKSLVNGLQSNSLEANCIINGDKNDTKRVKTADLDLTFGQNTKTDSGVKNYTPASEITTSRSHQPKRPMNAFMVWGQSIRRKLHDRFSNVQNALLSKALGRVWRTLNAATKGPFIDTANAIKANHKLRYPNYRYQPRRIAAKEVPAVKSNVYTIKRQKYECSTSQNASLSSNWPSTMNSSNNHYPIISAHGSMEPKGIEGATGGEEISGASKSMQQTVSFATRELKMNTNNQQAYSYDVNRTISANHQMNWSEKVESSSRFGTQMNNTFEAWSFQGSVHKQTDAVGNTVGAQVSTGREDNNYYACGPAMQYHYIDQQHQHASLAYTNNQSDQNRWINDSGYAYIPPTHSSAYITHMKQV